MQNITTDPAQVDQARPNALSSRPDITAELTRGVTRLFLDMDLAPLAEFKLANGRRADVAGLDRRGLLTIAEVKSCLADFEADQKWHEYLDYCDHFFFVVDANFPKHVLPQEEGLIISDSFGAAITRESQKRSLAAARRKAVTLRFARQSARQCLRLQRAE